MDVSRGTPRARLDTGETAAEIVRLASELGITVAPAQGELLARHVAAVLQAASSLNLTAILDVGDAVRLHVVDSLAVLRAVRQPESPAIDIGSGAGFPGVPLAVVASLRTTLLEPRAKRARFLQELVQRLDVADLVSVSHSRAEEEAATNPEGYRFAVARAVAPLPALVELASPLLAAGGEFAAMKGDLSADEEARGAIAAAKVGLQEVDAQRFVLPAGGETRTIVVYRKTHEPETPLPRRIGLAQKRPLA